MGYSLLGSSVHGIFQARVLEWGAIAFSRLLGYLGPNSVSSFTLRSGRWLLLAFPQHLSNHCGGWQHPRSPNSHLEARSRWWLWHFLFSDMAGYVFTSHCCLWYSHQGWFQTTVGKSMCFSVKSCVAHSVLPVGTRLYPCTTFELTVLRVVGAWCWNSHSSTSKKKKNPIPNFQMGRGSE